MRRIIHKIHKKDGSEILAACDRELLGKTIEDKDYSIKVSEFFYGNEAITEKALEKLLKNAGNANLIGEKVVSIALKARLITEKNIIKIGSTPHVQIYRL
ncbi:MAG: DUF424 domain-containing protein [Candidatus Diapherotrites archaeon CG08_land_8_20_14_0_20_34_12]|nr:MAG: DUF424 domain-containing protein [Candidatus Diapherotrites archaeon CG08_land_8_20_14_0_20_34_12]